MTFSFRNLLGQRVIDTGPLDHPDLRRMTPQELADLPLPRWSADPGASCPAG
jgi:hypothetical protein